MRDMEAGFESGLVSHIKTVGLDTAASSAAVNRTHRVVRERAKSREAQRIRIRSLWVPLTICFGLLASILFAIWNVLDESEMFAGGIPDSSQQMMMLGLWGLPLSVLLLAVVWFRLGTRTRNGSRQ